MERDLVPHTIIPFGYPVQMIFTTASGRAPRCLQMSPADAPAAGIYHSAMHLTFLGAAGTVTGSRHLLEVDGRRILVDCGLFQGLKELRERNWEPLPVDPASIDAVILTHAHLDHCGYLPRLVAMGYRGRIFCTPGTKDLCSLVLPDAAHIQEEDARDANRHGFTKHQPALPLYTTVDAARALDRLQPVGYDRPIPLWGQTGVRMGVRHPSDPGLAPTVEFINAGHLLGSVVRPGHGRRQDAALRRRPRPLRPARAAGPVARRRGGHPAPRVDLRRPAARKRRQRRSPGEHRHRHGASGAASSSFRPSRSGGSRRSSTG